MDTDQPCRRGRVREGSRTISGFARVRESRPNALGILFLNAGSYPRPGLHQLRAGPRQLPAGGQDRAGLRRLALADPIVERGARSGAAAFRRPSTRVRQAARHSARAAAARWLRSEEHTSELQSHLNLVCRLLLEKKKEAATAVSHLTENNTI